MQDKIEGCQLSRMLWVSSLLRYCIVIGRVIQSKSRALNPSYKYLSLLTILSNLVTRLLLKTGCSRSFVRKTFPTSMKILNIKLFLLLRLRMARLWHSAKNPKFISQWYQGLMIKSSDSLPWSTRATSSRSKKFPQPRQGLGALRLDQLRPRWRRTIKSTCWCNWCKELTNLWEWTSKPRNRSLKRSTKSCSDSRRDEGHQLIKGKL